MVDDNNKSPDWQRSKTAGNSAPGTDNGQPDTITGQAAVMISQHDGNPPINYLTLFSLDRLEEASRTLGTLVAAVDRDGVTTTKSRETLADLAGIGLSALDRHLDRLQRDGYLTAEYRPNKTQRIKLTRSRDEWQQIGKTEKLLLPIYARHLPWKQAQLFALIVLRCYHDPVCRDSCAKLARALNRRWDHTDASLRKLAQTGFIKYENRTITLLCPPGYSHQVENCLENSRPPFGTFPTTVQNIPDPRSEHSQPPLGKDEQEPYKNHYKNHPKNRLTADGGASRLEEDEEGKHDEIVRQITRVYRESYRSYPDEVQLLIAGTALSPSVQPNSFESNKLWENLQRVRKTIAEVQKAAESSFQGLLLYRMKQRPDWPDVENATRSSAAQQIRAAVIDRINSYIARRTCEYCREIAINGITERDVWNRAVCSKCSQTARDTEEAALDRWMQSPYKLDEPMQQIINRKLSVNWDTMPVDAEYQIEEFDEAKQRQQAIRDCLASLK